MSLNRRHEVLNPTKFARQRSRVNQEDRVLQVSSWKPYELICPSPYVFSGDGALRRESRELRGSLILGPDLHPPPSRLRHWTVQVPVNASLAPQQVCRVHPRAWHVQELGANYWVLQPRWDFETILDWTDFGLEFLTRSRPFALWPNLEFPRMYAGL